jgi:ankyrin repeat protein
MLMNLDTKEKVRHQLSHIRNSLLQNSLSAVYQNELEQIKGQGQKERNLAIEAMTWIYHAERPMKTMELLDILDFRFSNSYSASPSEPITISGVLNVCKGLLQAVLTTDTVSFVHFSVHEYLQGQTADHLILSEEIVAESCLNYLLHSISDNTNLNAAQFFSYAGNFWGSHYRHVGHETPLLLASCQRLLKDENAISVLYHFVSRRQDRESPTKDHPTEERSGKPSGLHLLSYFGLDWGLPIAKELDHSSDFLRDRFGKTPLHVAAEEGYPTCVQKLLDWDYSAVDADDFGRTPYHYAALGGHLKALKALGLMKSPTTLQPDNFGRTPLKYAIIAGRFGATCELLKISSHEGHLRDALQAALEGGDVKIVKVLLQSGAIPEYRHLLLAIKSGFEVAVKQLLEHGCTVNPPTDRCESALHAAVLARRNSILSFLVWNGANLEVEDEQGRKPLACAVERADYEAAQTLLQAGADPNVFIDTKSTIVHAASRGMSSIVELLLQAGSNMKDAALAATSHGQHEVLRLLLRSGLKVGPIAAADTEINGTSLLKEAVETGYKPVEALLRLSGAVGTTLAIDVHAPEKKQSSSNGNETSFVNDIIPLVTTKNYPDSQGIEFAKSPPSTLYRKVEEQRMDMPLPAERRLLAPIDSSSLSPSPKPDSSWHSHLGINSRQSIEPIGHLFHSTHRSDKKPSNEN